MEQQYANETEHHLDDLLMAEVGSLKDVCDECGQVLPSPVCEAREGGYSETVINCPCGATYTVNL